MGAYNTTDIVFGIMMLLVVFEGARRGTGWPIVIVAGAFLIYAFVGPYMPPIIAHRGFPLARTVPFLYLTTEGMFGIPLGVSAKFVLLFILYGAILEKTGAGKFFLDLALAIAIVPAAVRQKQLSSDPHVLGQHFRQLGGQRDDDGNVHHSAHEANRN